MLWHISNYPQLSCLPINWLVTRLISQNNWWLYPPKLRYLPTFWLSLGLYPQKMVLLPKQWWLYPNKLSLYPTCKRGNGTSFHLQMIQDFPIESSIAHRFPSVVIGVIPIVCPHVCLGWMVCPPYRGLVSPCFPSHCLPTCVPVLDGVSAFPSSGLSQLVSHCLPTCVHVLDGVSAFPGPCLPLSPVLFPFVGWCVRLPGFVFPCLPACVRGGWCVRLPRVPHGCLCCVSAFARSCLLLSPILPPTWWSI